MLYRDCIEKLLQLKDVIVTNIECQGREMHIWLQNGTTNALLPLLRNHHRQSPRLPHSTCKRYFHIRI